MKKSALPLILVATLFGLLAPQAARCDDSDAAVDSEGSGDLLPVPSDLDESGPSLNGHGVYSGVRNPEWAHHRYLQSRNAAHAEYTHYWNMYHAAQSPWHGPYYHHAWGRPLALVVPPTSDNQVKWGWGVGATEIVPLYHQFQRGNPATYPPDAWNRFRPQPYWPSHTDQFGVYPVRGPW